MPTKTTTQKHREELIATGTDWSSVNNLSPDVIKNLSPDVINNLSPDVIKNLSPDVIKNLSSDVINNLSPDVRQTLKDTVKLVIWEKPYTKLLEAIQRPGCVLDMSTWHSCETTHCVAGWTVTLAPGGKELEKRLGTALAARWILEASRPGAPLPRFDCDAPDDAVMAFIEARAEEEK